MEMKKVLMWGDYCTSTGFSVVMGHIARALHNSGKYELDIVAVNYTGNPYDRERWPGNIYPAQIVNSAQFTNIYGRERFIHMLKTKDYDIVFILQDLRTLFDTTPGRKVDVLQDMLDLRKEKGFKIIHYFPVDAPLKAGWVKYIVDQVDYPIAYTKYGLEQVRKIDPEIAKKVRIIYHGTGEDFFYVEKRVLVEKFRLAIFGELNDKFIIGNFNTNSPRKDIIRSFMILNELRKRGHKDIILYLHMSSDSEIGADLIQMGLNFKFMPGVDFLMAPQEIYETENSMDVKMVNMLYNAVDCTLNTALGGGWELQTTESFSTRTPTVAPDHTSFREIMNNNRGYLVRAGHVPSMWTMLPQDEERLRPLMDVKQAAIKIEWIKRNKLPDIEGAYHWAKEYSWDKITVRWLELFKEAAF